MTKIVLSVLIDIAVSEGLIRDLQQSLSQLLPQYQRIMKPSVAKATLQQLMSMTGGFARDVAAAEIHI